MPTVPNQPQGQPSNRIYVGVVYDRYTPEVENQMLRDVQQMRQVTERGEELVIACSDDAPDRMLAGIDTRRVPTLELASMWVVYRTLKDWPLPPAWCDTEIRRDLFVDVATPHLLQVDEEEANGFYLPPQGRLSPDTLSLNRPAPNGYVPVNPQLVAIWSKVVARLKRGTPI